MKKAGPIGAALTAAEFIPSIASGDMAGFKKKAMELANQIPAAFKLARPLANRNAAQAALAAQQGLNRGRPGMANAASRLAAAATGRFGQLKTKMGPQAREALRVAQQQFRGGQGGVLATVGRIATGIVQRFKPKLGPAAKTAWDGVRKNFDGARGGLLATTARVVTGVATEFGKVKPKLGPQSKSAWDGVRKAFDSAKPPLLNTTGATVAGVLEKFAGLKGIPAKIKPPMSAGQKEVESWKQKFLQSAVNIGVGVLQGMQQGLAGIVPMLAQAGSQLASTLSGSMKRKNKQRSPSLVFAEIGRGVGQGLVLGLRQSEGPVAAAARRLAGVTQRAMSGAVGNAARFAGGSVRMQRDPSGALIPQGSGRGATNLRGLANQISSTTRTATSEVARLLGNIRRQITQGMRAGASGSAMQGLRRASTVVQAEFTRRTTAMTARLKEQSAAMKRARTAVTRGLRRRGVDIASEDGFKAMQAYSKELVDQLTRQAAALRKQMMAARRAGQRDVSAKTRKKLIEVKDQLEETVTQMAEGARRAAAGDFGQYRGERDSEGSYAEADDGREEKREREEEKKQEREERKREKQEAKKAEREAKREAQKEHDDAMRENTAELKATREWGQRMASEEQGTLRRAIADIISGEIAGSGFRPRVQSAGVGSVARF